MGPRTDLNNHINRQVRLSTLYSVVPLDTAQYDSLSRLPTPHSNSRPMLLARPNCMHVSWRLSTPSMRNVAPTQRRFLMSVANASCFRHSCVPPEPSEPRWRKNATVYAKPSCTSSRKVRLVSHKKNKKHAPHVSTVEVCNDYSLWPHSGLASTSLASMIFFFFGFFLSLPLIRNDRQSNQSRVPSTSSRRRRGPRLHARTQLHCSPHYAKSANASVQRALRPCGASQNSKPSSRGAKRSLRGATRPRQRPPSSHFHVKAPSASCSNLPRVMWR